MNEQDSKQGQRTDLPNEVQAQWGGGMPITIIACITYCSTGRIVSSALATARTFLLIAAWSPGKSPTNQDWVFLTFLIVVAPQECPHMQTLSTSPRAGEPSEKPMSTEIQFHSPRWAYWLCSGGVVPRVQRRVFRHTECVLMRRSRLVPDDWRVPP